MRKNILFLSLWLMVSFSAFAQKTLDDVLPQSTYKQGVELFEAKHYGSAQMLFRQYLADVKKSDGSGHATMATTNEYNLLAQAEYYIAVSAIELGQSDADILLNNFINSYPEHPSARLISFYLGRYQYGQKNYAKAIEAFEKTDAYDLSDKNREDLYFMTGFSYYKLKKADAAKENFGKIRNSQTDNGRLAAYYYGLISYQQGRYDDALKEFNKIKADKKFKALLPAYIAQIYLLQGNYDKVIENGEEALNDQGTDQAKDVRLYVAQAYFAKKNYAKAAEHYQQYEISSGSLPEQLLYQYGFSLYNQGKYEEAIKAFSAMNIKEDSLGQNAAWHLGGSYLNTGNKEKARSSFQFASRLKYNKSLQEQALLNYSKLSYEENFQKEAIDGFKAFLKNYPNSTRTTEVKEMLSQILLAANNPKEALEVLESIPNRSDKLEEAYQKILYLYGMEMFNNRRFDEAEKYYTKSLQHESDRKIKALALFWLGETIYKEGRYEEARQQYKNFLYVSEAQETPYYNVANYNLGYTYFKKEDYQYSNIYFKKYLNNGRSGDINARFTDATLRSADCDFVMKNYNVAMNGYQKVIEASSPETDYAMYQKGIIQGLQGNSDQKINTLRSLTKKYPNSAYLDDALYAIAEEYKNKDNYTEAINAYHYLNLNYPKNPYFRAAILNIGMIYYNRQEDDKAVPIFKSIINKYPYSQEAKQALKVIKNSYIDRGMTDSLDAFYKTLPNSDLAPSSQDSDLYSAAFNNVKSNDCMATIKSMETYLKKFPNGYTATEANYNLAECALKERDSTLAQTHFNAVINRSPNTFMERSLKVSGQLYEGSRNYDMAAKRYSQLEEIAANKDNVLFAVNGELYSYYNQKNYDKAIEAGNKLLNLGYADAPYKLRAHYFIGKSEFELNKTEEALSSFSMVYKENKGSMGAEAMYLVALIDFSKEKITESEDLIYKLKDDFPSQDYWKAKAFILLADINIKKNDLFTAKNTLQSIVENSDSPELKKIAQDKLEQIKETEKNNPVKEEDK
jgi:TolA-binding protein